jgi:hypothetical protein
MRRSICVCDPGHLRAGQLGTWRWIYTTATPLAKGAKVKFDLLSQGRDIDWQIPSVSLKAKANVIYGLMDGHGPIAAKEVETPDGVVPQYEFTLPAELKAGESFEVVIGAPPGVESKEAGNLAQKILQRRRSFLIFVDPKGKGQYEAPETFTLDVRGGPLEKISIVAPSLVARNKRFDLTVRFEDCFGNLTNLAPPGTLIELSYQNLRENLNWKLFVPETGFINLPNLYFNEPGIYQIQLKNLSTGQAFTSSPIKCLAELPRQLFWGLLHGESERVDSTESIETCLRHFRDDCGFNFFATSPFDSEQETSAELWRSVSHNVAEFNEDERFSCFLGFQWVGPSPEEGLRQMIYSKDNKPLLRAAEMKSNNLSKIYRSHTPKDLISIPQFTMGSETMFDFSNWSADYERVVEIYNAWGSSEADAKSATGNPMPIAHEGKKGIGPNAEGAIQKALARNCRFGFVAGGLDDRGMFSEFFDGGQIQYHPGMTAILATAYTRDSLFDALQKRSCYATTGEKILVGLSIAGAQMGQELDTKAKPGLYYNRHITGYTACTQPIAKIELIRNGQVVHEWKSHEGHLDFSWDDQQDVREFAFVPGEDRPPFAYYYLRVTQSDGHMAWSSPIWIDFQPSDDFPFGAKNGKSNEAKAARPRGRPSKKAES